MDYIFLAVPFFFLLIAIELIVDRVRNTGYYRINDAISSLNAGVLSRINDIWRKLIPITMFVLISENFAIVELDNSLTTWIIAFVLYDFCYYWSHRMGHEINVFWASHVVHHSSEEYNLTTALRQTSGSFLGWIFYIPGALLGIDVVIWVSVGALNLLYQFWVHTRHIAKLGWYEWIFVTPSNHRVHHATNDVYIDRNYGGVFIIWDRLFNSFQEELNKEPVNFGIRSPLRSWNPIWTNLHFYAQLWSDAKRTESWRDKLRIWFMPTGWRPAEVEKKYPIAKFDPAKVVKFDPQIPFVNSVYSLSQHAVMIGITAMLMATVANMTSTEQLVWGGYVIFTALSVSEVISGKNYAVWLEKIRHLLLPILVLSFGYEQTLLYWAIGIALVSILAALKLKTVEQSELVISSN